MSNTQIAAAKLALAATTMFVIALLVPSCDGVGEVAIESDDLLIGDVVGVMATVALLGGVRRVTAEDENGRTYSVTFRPEIGWC